MINDAAHREKNNISGDGVVWCYNLLLIINLLKMETKVSLLTL